MEKMKNVKDTIQDMKQPFKTLAEKQLQGANDVHFTKNKVNDLENRYVYLRLVLDHIAVLERTLLFWKLKL